MDDNGESSQRKSRLKFSPEEDQKLRRLVKEYGANKWDLVSENMKNRNPRQCRERWKHYLSVPQNQKEWTPEEDSILMTNYLRFGKKWTKLAKFLKGRSDLAIKSRITELLRKEQQSKKTLLMSQPVSPAFPIVARYENKSQEIQNPEEQKPVFHMAIPFLLVN